MPIILVAIRSNFLLGPNKLRIFRRSWLVVLALVVAGGLDVRAQTVADVPSIALKSGEATELGDLSWVTSNCSSLLTGTPTVEIIDGPPGVTLAVKDAMVMPRAQNCAKRVAGGKLMIIAEKIEDASRSALTIRVTYKTKDGERKFSQTYNLSLFP